MIEFKYKDEEERNRIISENPSLFLKEDIIKKDEKKLIFSESEIIPEEKELTDSDKIIFLLNEIKSIKNRLDVLETK